MRGLTDAQAGRRSTASELTLGGILKHLAQGERVWAQLISERRGETPDGMWDMGQYHLAADDTLADLRAAYAAATRAMDAAVAALPDLDVAVPLPPVPWDPEAAPETWTARRALLHMLRETAQHAGHADIIRSAWTARTPRPNWATPPTPADSPVSPASPVARVGRATNTARSSGLSVSSTTARATRPHHHVSGDPLAAGAETSLDGAA
ncbi:mycothiol transferase [Streptomyces buecherae]|uniref:mycothiol transferase n=1 Tax=Streptomyces buecherae TaxID=2763006 RepID=UPI0037918D51